jgi:parvulin-like peptidyl-prolyl isomerase
MHLLSRAGLSLLLLGLVNPGAAEDKPAMGNAATVNGQPIPEAAVQRALRSITDPEQRAQARSRVLNSLLDQAVLDQHLIQLGVEVPKAEVDARLNEVKDEIKKKSGKTFEEALKKLALTEPELRDQLGALLRWEKYAASKATDQELKQLFDREPEIFDGTMVRARHILLTPAAGDPKAAAKAREQLLGFKKQVEEEAEKEVAKLPEGTDLLAKDKARGKALEQAFAAVARKESACPSKEQGGDLDFFPRSGSMVEPFARAAFALKPTQLSDLVQTQFGYHLILVTDRRPGKETKFEDVKEVVREVFAERLQRALCANLRTKANIVITPQTKP